MRQYIYKRVCVCVCVLWASCGSLTEAWEGTNKRKFPLHPRYNVAPRLKVEADDLFHSLANIVAR